MKTNTFNFYPLAFLLLIIGMSFSFSAFHASSAAASKSVHREVQPQDTPISLKIFSTLSRKEFESRTGQKLSLGQRILFKMMQRKIRKNLKKNPEAVDHLASVSLASGVLSLSFAFLILAVSNVTILIVALILAAIASITGFVALRILKAKPDGHSAAKSKAQFGCILGLSILIIASFVVIFFLLTFED